MSKSEKERMKLTVELVRRGGTILRDACPTCGGIQIRYHSKNYCTSHEDLTSVLSTEELSMDFVLPNLRELLFSKVKDTTEALGKERDVVKQDQLVSLLAKYMELLQKLPVQK
ncbi:MAG: hypothetical protein OK422_03345 [Thaumarchaeota archaeon]|nr:hypothetical protein [Nitrososphaerota archaeon]